jgi:hypothetical protein
MMMTAMIPQRFPITLQFKQTKHASIFRISAVRYVRYMFTVSAKLRMMGIYLV